MYSKAISPSDNVFESNHTYINVMGKLTMNYKDSYRGLNTGLPSHNIQLLYYIKNT